MYIYILSYLFAKSKPIFANTTMQTTQQISNQVRLANPNTIYPHLWVLILNELSVGTTSKLTNGLRLFHLFTELPLLNITTGQIIHSSRHPSIHQQKMCVHLHRNPQLECEYYIYYAFIQQCHVVSFMNTNDVDAR